MARVRLVLGALLALLGLPSAVLFGTTLPAEAVVHVVTLVSDSADISTSQVVDATHQNATDTANRQFLTFAQRMAPATVTTPAASASAVASQTTSLSSTAALPLPLHPLDDISVVGAATTAAAAAATSSVVPSAGSAGGLNVRFSTIGAVPVFFSGLLRTSNADANDSCSLASVELTGPVSRTFSASAGSVCATASPGQVRWALSMTLPAGDYSFTVGYSSNVDDNANDKEPTSLAASATVSVDLSFLPPTAAFTKVLSGFRADFDGSSSSRGVAGRPLTKWLWNFGDGKTAVTTTPRISHTYPRQPRTAPAYRVSLQVIDSGHARSAILRRTVLGTATTATVGRTRTRLSLSGQVRPNPSGRHVVVTLSRERGGIFRVLATHRPTLSALSRFATSFPRPAAGICRLAAKYPGDATHLASATQDVVRC